MREVSSDAMESIINSGEDRTKMPIPEELRLLPLRDTVLFPLVVSPLSVGRESSIKLIDDAVTSGERIIAVATLRDPQIEHPKQEDIYPVGTAIVIHTMMRLPDNIRLIVQGIQRIRIREITQLSLTSVQRLKSLLKRPIIHLRK